MVKSEIIIKKIVYNQIVILKYPRQRQAAAGAVFSPRRRCVALSRVIRLGNNRRLCGCHQRTHSIH